MTTVILSMLRSITVEPMALEPIPPPNMSDRPPPLPLCISTSTSMNTDEMTSRGTAIQVSSTANTLDDRPFPGEVAGDRVLDVVGPPDLEQRFLLGADRRVGAAVLQLLAVPAPGAEPAARGRVDRRRRVARQDDP